MLISLHARAQDLYSNFTGNDTIVYGFPSVDLNFYIQGNTSSSFATTWTAGQFAAASADMYQDPRTQGASAAS